MHPQSLGLLTLSRSSTTRLLDLLNYNTSSTLLKLVVVLDLDLVFFSYPKGRLGR